MADTKVTDADARDTIVSYLKAKEAIAAAQEAFVAAEKNYRQAVRDAAKKLDGIIFKTKDGHKFFSKVRGEGNYAFKPTQATWKVEGKQIVDVSDLA